MEVLVYENGEKEQFLKQNGVLLNDIGGDVGGPILRTEEGGVMMLLGNATQITSFPFYDVLCTGLNHKI